MQNTQCISLIQMLSHLLHILDVNGQSWLHVSVVRPVAKLNKLKETNN